MKDVNKSDQRKKNEELVITIKEAFSGLKSDHIVFDFGKVPNVLRCKVCHAEMEAPTGAPPTLYENLTQAFSLTHILCQEGGDTEGII
jgi:hypothetical protein